MQTIRHRGMHSFDAISATVAVGALGGIAPNPFGRQWYVDPIGGSDSFAGTTPGGPKKTLQAAIDLCTHWGHDVIYVSRGNHAVTSPVLFNKQGITVIANTMGLPFKSSAERFTINGAVALTDQPAAIITHPCRIIGMGFASRDATKENCRTSAVAGGWDGGFIHFLGCRFSCWYGVMDAGLRCMAGDGIRVEDCTFEGLFGGFGTAAIVLQNGTEAALWGPPNMRIIGNDFCGVGNAKHAIKTATAVSGLIVAHNYLSAGFSGYAGKLLDNNSLANTGQVVGNYVGGANKAAAFDNQSNTALIFAGNHYNDA